jgi:hypothetical protein
VVDRARHRRPGIVDRTVSLSDMARLPSAAKSRDRGRTRAAPARQRISYRSRTYSYPQDARPSDRIGSMEGRDARSVDNRPRAYCRSRKRALIGVTVPKSAAPHKTLAHSWLGVRHFVWRKSPEKTDAAPGEQPRRWRRCMENGMWFHKSMRTRHVKKRNTIETV